VDPEYGPEHLRQSGLSRQTIAPSRYAYRHRGRVAHPAVPIHVCAPHSTAPRWPAPAARTAMPPPHAPHGPSARAPRPRSAPRDEAPLSALRAGDRAPARERRSLPFPGYSAPRADRDDRQRDRTFEETVKKPKPPSRSDPPGDRRTPIPSRAAVHYRLSGISNSATSPVASNRDSGSSTRP
jgi:hypothetical protein